MLVEYLLCFPFFRIVDQAGCWLEHSVGLKNIIIVLPLFLQVASVKVGFLLA